MHGIADARDPFFRMVRRSIGPASSVLDVGARAGRHALALAPEVDELIAVEPSRDLVQLLGQQSGDYAGGTSMALLTRRLRPCSMLSRFSQGY